MIGYKVGHLVFQKNRVALHNSEHNVKKKKNKDEKYPEEDT